MGRSTVLPVVAVVLMFLLLRMQAVEGGEKAMPATGQAYFVATNGNDADAGTQERPWRTIQHAVDQLRPGETAYVRGGVYRESVLIEKKGTPDGGLNLESYPGECAIIDPEFTAASGIRISGEYIKIKGFEIRNCKPQAGQPGEIGALAIFSSNHCVAEQNTIHHIIGLQDERGRGGPAVGIHVTDSDAITIQNNTVYDIVGHPESMGIMADTVSSTAIRRNLVYLCDKEGIRLLTWARESDNVIEGNITLSNNMGIAANMCPLQEHTTTITNNFTGWNCSHGMQIKHTNHALVTHNTIYGNHDPGLRFNDRPFNYYAVVKNNILSSNRLAWSIIDGENFHEMVDYDFYQYPAGSLLATFDWSTADRCYSLADIQKKTAEAETIETGYESHGREGDPRFVDAAGHDFRLRPDSPARGAADDGKDMGALAGELIEVGADKAYSLAKIPDLGELDLRVESVSSESEKGRAANAVDGRYDTYWEIDATKDGKREIVLALSGDSAHELTFLTLTKAADRDNYYRQFRVYVDDGSGQWRAIADPAEHPFIGYTSRQGINNGETWALPAGTRARKLKIEIVSGYSDVIRIPQIRVYTEQSRSRGVGEKRPEPQMNTDAL